METVIAIRNTHRPVTIDEVEGVISGYVYIWGTTEQRDEYDTWFDRARPPQLSYSGDITGLSLTYEHAQDDVVKKDLIGEITDFEYDETGLRFEAQLDRSSPFFGRVITEADVLSTSSASSPHLASFREDGSFESWVLSEVALTQYPAETRMPNIKVVRSSAEEQLRVAQEDDELVSEATEVEAIENEDSNESHNTEDENEMPDMQDLEALADSGASIDEVIAFLVENYSQEELTALMAAMQEMGEPEMLNAPANGDEQEEQLEDEGARSANPVSVLVEALRKAQEKADAAALTTRIQKLETALTAMKNAPPEENNDRHTRGVPGNNIETQGEPRIYSGLSARAMLFGHQILRSRHEQPSDEYLRVMNMRAVEALEAGQFKTTIDTDPAPSDRAVRSIMPFTRADEVMTSTASGFGDEWVAIAWSTNVWEKARNIQIFESLISKGMRVEEVPQGHESINILGDGADPTVYTIAQNADLTSNRPTPTVAITPAGTIVRLLTPGELGAAIAFSDVFEEDSLVPALSQLQQQIEDTMAEHIEKLMLNGDTETGGTGNINSDDGAPGTGLSTPYYIASNAMLKLAIVTNTDNSRDGGALDENDYRETLKLFASALRSRRGNIAFVVDSDTHSASLDIAAVKTDDVRRTNATITSGVLSNIWGVDVFESGFMGLAEADGKQSTTPSNNTLGRILAVYAPNWAMGWKRHIKVETDRDIIAGTDIIVAKMRLGFQYRTTDSSAVSYNLTV